eukprot:evm.model.NODE_3106_length_7779_cov_20.765137.2
MLIVKIVIRNTAYRGKEKVVEAAGEGEGVGGGAEEEGGGDGGGEEIIGIGKVLWQWESRTRADMVSEMQKIDLMSPGRRTGVS